MNRRSIYPLAAVAILAITACGLFAPRTPAPLAARAVALAVTTRIEPGKARYQAQALEGYTVRSIRHLLLAVSELTEQGPVPVEDAPGHQVQADLMAGDIGNVVRFDGLTPGKRFRVTCRAFKAAGTDPADLISDDLRSFADIDTAGDQAVVSATLQVHLIDQLVDARARGQFDVKPGALLVPAVASATRSADVSDVAGSTRGYLDGLGPVAQFDTPYGLAIDASGAIYVADSGNRKVRRILGGVVTTVSSYSADASSLGGSAISPFGFADGLALAGDGALALADSRRGTITRVSRTSAPLVLAGDGQTGLVDGESASASFALPSGIVRQPDGSILVADTLNNCVRWVDPIGITFTWLGDASPGYQDGFGRMARFNHPTGITRDNQGNLYIADTDNNVIRKVDAGGWVSRYAGDGQVGDDDGPAPQARFDGPTGLAIDDDGTLYVADTNNNTIRSISPAGLVTTLSGSGFAGSSGGANASARFAGPTGLALDGQGFLIVADTLNHKVRRVRVR